MCGVLGLVFSDNLLLCLLLLHLRRDGGDQSSLRENFCFSYTRMGWWWPVIHDNLAMTNRPWQIRLKLSRMGWWWPVIVCYWELHTVELQFSMDIAYHWYAGPYHRYEFLVKKWLVTTIPSWWPKLLDGWLVTTIPSSRSLTYTPSVLNWTSNIHLNLKKITAKELVKSMKHYFEFW